MTELNLAVEKREATGKNENRRLRSGGRIPAVVYGGGKEPIPIQIDRRAFLDLTRHGSGENSIFLLELAGADQKRHAMIRDLQVDPVSRRILHIDFQRVLMTEKLRVAVSIELTGTAYGVKNEAAVIDFVTREVEVECLPGDIPAHLALDVTPLHVGQHLEAGAIELPAGVRLITDPERVIASCSHARLEVEAPAAAETLIEGTSKEPEVMTRGKEKAED